MSKTTTPARPFPHYQHDCRQCTWLGDFQHKEGIYDLYFCASEPTIIARYSDEPQDYHSGIVFGIISYPALREALIRSLLLPEPRTIINEHVLRFEHPEHIELYREILTETDLRKVQKEIETEAQGLLDKYLVSGRLAAEEMSITELKTLVAVSHWKDGMDWKDVEANRTEPRARAELIAVLKNIYGYDIITTMKGS